MSEINKSVNYLTQSGNTYTLNQDIVLSDNSYFNLNNETFDGSGHTITIDRVTDFSGLFQGISTDGDGGTYYDLSGSIIKNLGVLSTTSTLSDYGGWIVREKNTSFIVEKCYSTGTIGGIDSGGICGYACTYNAIVKDCYSTGDINAQSAGGICGGCYGNNAKGIFISGTNGAYIFKNSTSRVENCFSMGTISGSSAGGICGRGLGLDSNRSSSNSFVIVNNCYSTGDISGSSAGGITGIQSAQRYGIVLYSNCYSTGSFGSSSGVNAGSIFSLFNVSQTSGENYFYNCYSTNTPTVGTNLTLYTGTDYAVEDGFLAVWPTQHLSQTSNNTVALENSQYEFNDVLYANIEYIGVNIGTYTLSDVPDSHPIGFVISGTDKLEVLSGSSAGTEIVDGISVEHFHGDVVFEVKDDFGTISYKCFNHGYMGGQNRLKYIASEDIYYVSGTPDTFTDNLSSIRKTSGANLLNGNQTSTIWTATVAYPVHTYAFTLLVSTLNYSLFPPPAVASLTQDTYYHTFYQVSQSDPKVMTSYTYNNSKNLIETVDISFGDYTISEVLQIMDSGGGYPYVIGSNDKGTKFPMSIAYCDVFNDFLTPQKQKEVISGVNRQDVYDVNT